MARAVFSFIRTFLFLALCLSLFLNFPVFRVHADPPVFNDLPGDPLYDPYILHFTAQGFISGYQSHGKPTGKFGPYDELERSQMAKLSASVRLAEEKGIAQKWYSKTYEDLTQTILKTLSPYLNCVLGACKNIGNKPFPDVKEKESTCSENPSGCQPWYTEFVYFAVDRGYIQGFETPQGPKFRPHENTLRSHAMKLIIADNGHLEPQQDLRFQRLLYLATQKGYDSPPCLQNATSYMLQNGDDAKLVAYSLLADQLRLFGSNCEVFTQFGKHTPKERADFMHQNITRMEAVRYFGMTTSYAPLHNLSFIPQSTDPPAPEPWMEMSLEELLEENEDAFIQEWLQEQNDPEEKEDEDQEEEETVEEELTELEKEMQEIVEEAMDEAMEDDSELEEALDSNTQNLPTFPAPQEIEKWLKENGLVDSNASAMEAWNKAKGNEATYNKSLKLLNDNGSSFSIPANTPLKVIAQDGSYALVWPQGYLRPYRVSCDQVSLLCADSLLIANAAVTDMSQALSPAQLLEQGVTVYAPKSIYICRSEYDCFSVAQGTKMKTAGKLITSRTSSDGKTSLWQPVWYQGEKHYALVRDINYQTSDENFLKAIFGLYDKNFIYHRDKNQAIEDALKAYFPSHSFEQTLQYGMSLIGKDAQEPRSFEYKLVNGWVEQKKVDRKKEIRARLEQEFFNSNHPSFGDLKGIRDWGRGDKQWKKPWEYAWVNEWYEERESRRREVFRALNDRFKENGNWKMTLNWGTNQFNRDKFDRHWVQTWYSENEKDLLNAERPASFWDGEVWSPYLDWMMVSYETGNRQREAGLENFILQNKQYFIDAANGKGLTDSSKVKGKISPPLIAAIMWDEIVGNPNAEGEGSEGYSRHDFRDEINSTAVEGDTYGPFQISIITAIDVIESGYASKPQGYDSFFGGFRGAYNEDKMLERERIKNYQGEYLSEIGKEKIEIALGNFEFAIQVAVGRMAQTVDFWNCVDNLSICPNGGADLRYADGVLGTLYSQNIQGPRGVNPNPGNSTRGSGIEEKSEEFNRLIFEGKYRQNKPKAIASSK